MSRLIHQTDLTVFSMSNGRLQHRFGLCCQLTLLQLLEVVHGEEAWLLPQVSRKSLQLSQHTRTQTQMEHRLSFALVKKKLQVNLSIWFIPVGLLYNCSDLSLKT